MISIENIRKFKKIVKNALIDNDLLTYYKLGHLKSDMPLYNSLASEFQKLGHVINTLKLEISNVSETIWIVMSLKDISTERISIVKAQVTFHRNGILEIHIYEVGHKLYSKNA